MRKFLLRICVKFESCLASRKAHQSDEEGLVQVIRAAMGLLICGETGMDLLWMGIIAAVGLIPFIAVVIASGNIDQFEKNQRMGE